MRFLVVIISALLSYPLFANSTIKLDDEFKDTKPIPLDDEFTPGEKPSDLKDEFVPCEKLPVNNGLCECGSSDNTKFIVSPDTDFIHIYSQSTEPAPATVQKARQNCSKLR